MANALRTISTSENPSDDDVWLRKDPVHNTNAVVVDSRDIQDVCEPTFAPVRIEKDNVILRRED